MTSPNEAGDLEKLQQALEDVAAAFGSVGAVLDAFGLSNMPAAQQYGILFGCLVFICTVSTVIALLVFGGSFQRIAEQEKTGKPTLLTATEVRKERALLLEMLLEGRERMKKNYPELERSETMTNLTHMLLNVAPDPVQANQQISRYIPPHYEENYASAYRKCQDHPGGEQLSGRPEARFEAYARAFAACGPYTSLEYRRSYARLYESLCCKDHKSDDKYAGLFEKRPSDIIGWHVRLEAASTDRHLSEFYHITNGAATLQTKSYDPLEVWGFQPDGPFSSPKEMRESFVFMRLRNEASFAVIHSITDELVGVVLLTHDAPEHLSIQIEPPLMPPGNQGTQHQLEACFLLIDRLFAYGYRRIQMSVDSQDPDGRKLAARLGFTEEGVLFKHLVMKDASRDSSLHGLLNSDWKRGARAVLFTKLYGEDAMKADRANEKKEAEMDEQNKVLAQQETSNSRDKK